MARMLDLRDILELIDNGLDNRPFAQQELVGKMHKLIFHVFAQSGDQMEPLFKEQCGQGSGNVATIPEELATQFFDHRGNRLAIIDIARGQTTRQQFALVIDRQVELETEEPAHAALATLGIRRKDAVLVDPFGITDFQRRRVDEADACAGSIARLHIGKQRKHHRRDERNKARITHQVRKFLVSDALGHVPCSTL